MVVNVISAAINKVRAIWGALDHHKYNIEEK